MQRKIFLLLFLFSLLFSTASAVPPREGVYEKTSGTPARMVVMEPDGRKQLADIYAPLIGLETFDERGEPVLQMAALYSGKTETAGAGENWLELAGQDLKNALTGNGPFSLCLYGAAHPKNGREQINFFFNADGTAEVYQAGENLNGTYRYSSAEIKEVPLLLPLLVWKLSLSAPYSREPFPVWRAAGQEKSGTWHFLIGKNKETELVAARDFSRAEERTKDI